MIEEIEKNSATKTAAPMDAATTGKRRGLWIRTLSLVAMAFGLMTIKEGGLTLAGNPAALVAAGNYVPFVLWFNFLAGFAYVVAGTGLWRRKSWAVWLAGTIAAATALFFIAFGAHVVSGGAYEQRTVIAMTVRTFGWVVITIAAWAALRPEPTRANTQL